MSSFQDLFDQVNLEFKELEQDFLELERKYFEIEPVFKRIDKRMNTILDALQEKGASPLSRRIANLKFYLRDMQRRRGYDSKSFSRALHLVRKVIEVAPEEIFPSRLLTELKTRLERDRLREQGEAPLEPATKTVNKEDLYQLLMVRSGRMHFLVGYEEKLWQREVPNKKNLKLRVNALEGSEEYQFTPLPGDRTAESVQRTAVLVRKQDGSHLGLLVDECQGTIYLKPELYDEKLEYLQVDGSDEPFIRLRGERYYVHGGGLP